MLFNTLLLNSTPKPQNHLLKQIRDQLDKAKKTLPKNDIFQEKNHKKKALNKSMGNNNNIDSSFTLLSKENTQKQDLLYKTQDFSKKEESFNMTKEISMELMKAMEILKNSKYNEEFFKTIIKDISNLLEILNEITMEVSNFSDTLKKQVEELESENKVIKNELANMIKKNEEIVTEINQLKSKEKHLIFDDKSNISSINSSSIGVHSTKNSEELSKIRRFLTDLKAENQLLLEENSLLKLEHKKACEMVVQQKSTKIMKNVENSLKMINMTNNNVNHVGNAHNDNENKKEVFLNKNIKNINSLNTSEIGEGALEKGKKYRFVKPKN